MFEFEQYNHGDKGDFTLEERYNFLSKEYDKIFNQNRELTKKVKELEPLVKCYKNLMEMYKNGYKECEDETCYQRTIRKIKQKYWQRKIYGGFLK